MEKDINEFDDENQEDLNESGNSKNDDEGEQKIRVKFPYKGQVIGLIDQRVGASRMLVKCSDGKTRNCKVPGRLRRSLWIREGDFVIIQPWEFDNEKGDILYKYSLNAIAKLRQMGKLDNLEE